MDSLADVVDDLEESSDVWDYEDLHKLSELMYEGLATNPRNTRQVWR